VSLAVESEMNEKRGKVEENSVAFIATILRLLYLARGPYGPSSTRPTLRQIVPYVSRCLRSVRALHPLDTRFCYAWQPGTG
jgi:hypothetical protein